MKNFWNRIKWVAIRVFYIVVVCAILISLFLLVRLGYSYDWTGFGPSTRPVDPTQQFIPAKNLWDWLGLLIIPLVLAIGGLLFSRAERRNEQLIAQQRIEEERRIAEGNTQHATLQTYLDQMSRLLLDKDLLHSQPESEGRAIARALTLTVLRRLNEDSKGLLLRFLYESDLILSTNVISLEGANLERANLVGAYLERANLEGANLERANLVGAILINASLENAILVGADLSLALLDANLAFTNLEGADLIETSMVGARVVGANLEKANLARANLTEANLMKANLKKAILGLTNLEKAGLMGANLTEANMRYTNLKGANLKEANLEKAILEGANLKEAFYNADTKWPKGFDPQAAGAILITEDDPM